MGADRKPAFRVKIHTDHGSQRADVRKTLWRSAGVGSPVAFYGLGQGVFRGGFGSVGESCGQAHWCGKWQSAAMILCG